MRRCVFLLCAALASGNARAMAPEPSVANHSPAEGPTGEGTRQDGFPGEPAPAVEAAPAALPPAPAPVPEPAANAAAKRRLDPRVHVGVAAAATGAVLAVLGIALAVASVMATAAWPRHESDGTLRPLFSAENGALVSIRVYGTLAFIPVGLAVALAGLVTLATGVGLAVYGFTLGD